MQSAGNPFFAPAFCIAEGENLAVRHFLTSHEKVYLFRASSDLK